jgi:DNA polymerase-1
VEAEFGVPARLMVDFQTLVGDAVDNVPGVAKVGPKTAAKWLQEYGSLEALVANAGNIKGVVGENLRKALDWLPTGRQLLTIKTDCDLAGFVDKLPAMDSIAINAQDTSALKAFYESYGFKGLAKALGGDAPGAAEGATTKGSSGTASSGLASPGLFDEPEAAAVPVASRATTLSYDTVLTWAMFDDWLTRISAAELVALDTETTSLDEMRAEIVGISFSVKPGEAAYIPLTHDYPDAPAQLPRDEVLARLKPWLEDGTKKKLGQVRPPCVCQPRHRSARVFARHHAAELRA